MIHEARYSGPAAPESGAEGDHAGLDAVLQRIEATLPALEPVLREWDADAARLGVSDG